MGRIGHEWAETIAAKMLSDGVEHAKSELGLSVRKIGQMLGYKQATVVSHMANGRSPIPIERAEEMAKLLHINIASFLQAVVEQRYPSVDWSLINRTEIERLDVLGRELEAIIEAPLAELNEHQREVMREVAAEPQPRLRWLSVVEAAEVRTRLGKASPRQDFATSQDDIDEILSKLAEDDK